MSNEIFFWVHIDCHIDVSTGAGIQPMKAARNIIPSNFDGMSCFVAILTCECKLARNTAAIVEILKTKMIALMRLSNKRYRPMIKIKRQLIVMIQDHRVRLDVTPKSLTASPAVTMVTAA